MFLRMSFNFYTLTLVYVNRCWRGPNVPEIGTRLGCKRASWATPAQGAEVAVELDLWRAEPKTS